MDVRFDPANCGDCGAACAATEVCSNSKCKADCALGQTKCEVEDVQKCVDTREDLEHCGGCNEACSAAPANAESTCEQGTCGWSCNPGFGDCNVEDSDGCEAELATSLDNCGGCGNPCASPANGTTSCVDGACEPTCDAGYDDCNVDMADGCETMLATDPANCGACGKACTATELCVDADSDGYGECVPTCVLQTYKVEMVAGPKETIASSSCDLDKDGFADAIFVNQLSNDVSIYWGNAGGALGQPTLVSVGRSGQAAVCGDYNADGLTDFLVTRQDSNDLAVVLATGNRQFGSGITTSSLQFASTAAALDADKDGKLDVLVRTGGTPFVGPSSTQTWQLLRGKGDGTFETPTTAFVKNDVSYRLLDVDGDGKVEWIEGDASPFTVSSVGSDGALTQVATVTLDGCLASGKLTSNDGNGDGLDDLYAVCGDEIRQFLNLGGYQFV